MSVVQVKPVMVGLAAAVQTVLATGRTAHSRPFEGAKVGDAVVAYPTDPITVSATFRRGTDRLTVPVYLLCGMAYDEATQTAIDAWIGSGSVVAAIEGYAGTWSSVSVTQVQIETYSPTGGTPLVALRYDVDVLS
jgi:hypothetical protein